MGTWRVKDKKCHHLHHGWLHSGSLKGFSLSPWFCRILLQLAMQLMSFSQEAFRQQTVAHLFQSTNETQCTDWWEAVKLSMKNILFKTIILLLFLEHYKNIFYIV